MRVKVFSPYGEPEVFESAAASAEYWNALRRRVSCDRSEVCAMRHHLRDDDSLVFRGEQDWVEFDD